MKRYVVNESEGVKGKLPVPGGGGTFNILIDEEISGAKYFSLLVNEMAPGTLLVYLEGYRDHPDGRGDVLHQTRRCGLRPHWNGPFRGMHGE
jgi:hypothetical protein